MPMQNGFQTGFDTFHDAILPWTAEGNSDDDSFIDFTPREFFGANPRAAYFAQRPRFGRSPNQLRFFENSFQDIMDEFQGALGQRVNQGQPLQDFTFQSFVEDFPFTNRFLSKPPSLRGGERRRFAPFAQFRF